jgi:hypothetical protein
MKSTVQIRMARRVRGTLGCYAARADRRVTPTTDSVESNPWDDGFRITHDGPRYDAEFDNDQVTAFGA